MYSHVNRGIEMACSYQIGRNIIVFDCIIKSKFSRYAKTETDTTFSIKYILKTFLKFLDSLSNFIQERSTRECSNAYTCVLIFVNIQLHSCSFSSTTMHPSGSNEFMNGLNLSSCICGK